MSYSQIKSGQTVSVLAKQSSNRLSNAFTLQPRVMLEPIMLRGKKYFKIRNGIVTKNEMMNDFKFEATMMVWIMRAISFMLVFIGIRTIFGLVDYFLATVPGFICGFLGCLQQIAECFLCLVAFFAASWMWFLVWGICWLIFRPMYLIIICPIGIIPLAITCCCQRKRKTHHNNAHQTSKQIDVAQQYPQTTCPQYYQ